MEDTNETTPVANELKDKLMMDIGRLIFSRRTKKCIILRRTQQNELSLKSHNNRYFTLDEGLFDINIFGVFDLNKT